MYHIAMGELLDILLLHLLILFDFSVLYPQLKLKYFQQCNWQKDWIDTAEAIVRDEYVKYDIRSTLGPVLVCSSIIFKCFLFTSVWQAVPLVDDVDATTDFLNIPMDGLKDTNKLNEYLSKLLRRSLILSNGGGIIGWSILSCQQWHLMFLVFQVCHIF